VHQHQRKPPRGAIGLDPPVQLPGRVSPPVSSTYNCRLGKLCRKKSHAQLLKLEVRSLRLFLKIILTARAAAQYYNLRILILIIIASPRWHGLRTRNHAPLRGDAEAAEEPKEEAMPRSHSLHRDPLGSAPSHKALTCRNTPRPTPFLRGGRAALTARQRARRSPRSWPARPAAAPRAPPRSRTCAPRHLRP
jgi:hypothetical protein